MSHAAGGGRWKNERAPRFASPNHARYDDLVKIDDAVVQAEIAELLGLDAAALHSLEALAMDEWDASAARENTLWCQVGALTFLPCSHSPPSVSCSVDSNRSFLSFSLAHSRLVPVRTIRSVRSGTTSVGLVFIYPSQSPRF